ncbi:MAG: 2-dehydropantoate 2-reductase [Alphaproteobacteria bacterium]|nr:2-dehydropantoate 2-reductase [Alphaproteobacteria bacterium]
MRVTVIGAGGMGSLYGGLLARSGVAVTLFGTWAAHMAAIARDGLRLDGLTGDQTIRLKATSDPAEAGPADLAIVLVDANATAEAAATAQRILSKDGAALSLQNCIGNLERLEERLGRARVLGGLSYHSAAVRGPGHVSHTHAGPTWLGELDGKTSPRIAQLAAMFAKAGFKPEVVGDIVGDIWDKFVHNSAINALSALTGLRVGELSWSPEMDRLQSHVMDEIMAVLGAKGIALPHGDPRPAIKAFCKLKFNKPSMLQHVEAGKRSEIDWLNGAIVREGQRLSVTTPYNEAVTLLVKGLEMHRQRAVHGPQLDYAQVEAAAGKS